MSAAGEVSKLELAARSLDLTTALLKATTSSGSLRKGAWEVGQWLGRERLNQYELLECMEKAKGLVFANARGNEFFEKVIRGLETQAVAPLFLQQSGSLGRLMPGDPNLSWVVSTVACLFQHSRDERLVTEKLTSFIMESNRALGPFSRIEVTNLVYSPEQIRLRAVVRKIVLSVWYNVVNVGCDTISLPSELLSICSEGHTLDAHDFGMVINTLHNHCPNKATLRSDHLLRDVMLWLLLHYDGNIIVNVGGEIVYRAEVDYSEKEIEVHVKSRCSPENCHGDGAERYKIFRHVSNNLNEFLYAGHSWADRPHLAARSGTRQSLYDIPRPYFRDSPMFDKTIQLLVKRTAQSTMRWLLERPLVLLTTLSQPGFGVKVDRAAGRGELSIQQALKRVPEMVNLIWGSTADDTPLVYAGLYGSANEGVYSGIDGAPNLERRMKAIVRFSPILEDLVRRASVTCACAHCGYTTPQSDLAENNLKPGCLRRMALDEVFLLLGHGIADGFGVKDVSAVADTTPIVTAVVDLLLELMTANRIQWDVWFMLASCVYLGCPYDKPVAESHPADGGTSYAAIQYGNLATQAPWLDLSKEITVQGCFGLVGSSGRLGVLIDGGGERMQFRSVEENFSIIETENTEDSTQLCRHSRKAATVVDQNFTVSEDLSSVESDVILYQMDEKFYRLLLRIKSNNHWRIIDPSDALCGAIRMIPVPSCPHNQPTAMAPLDGKVYSLDEVVGRWPDTVATDDHTTSATSNKGLFHISALLSSHFKLNSALALSVCTVALVNNPTLTCPSCMVKHARQAEMEPFRKDEGGNRENRYIINFKADSTAVRQLKALRLGS